MFWHVIESKGRLLAHLHNLVNFFIFDKPLTSNLWSLIFDLCQSEVWFHTYSCWLAIYDLNSWTLNLWLKHSYLKFLNSNFSSQTIYFDFHPLILHLWQSDIWFKTLNQWCLASDLWLLIMHILPFTSDIRFVTSTSDLELLISNLLPITSHLKCETLTSAL